MHCSHCCFSYGQEKGTPIKGKHMPIDMFRHIMKQASEYEDTVTIGGAEICMYDNFEQMIGIIACYSNKDNPPFIVTNGSIKDRALLLNRLAISGIIGCELSQDEFHDSIDYEVIDKFNDRSAIRNVTKRNSLIYAGRAKTQNAYILRKECPCDSMQFYPTGIVKWCGCSRSPIITKNIMEEFNLPDNFNGACHKYAEELVEA
jgi:hypothetical protein